MITIKHKKRIKIKDLKIKVAQKMYDMYRNDPNHKFDEEKFKRLLNDELDVEYKDFYILMEYMKERDYIISRQNTVEGPRYFLVRPNLIDFVENLPNVNDE